MVKIIIGVSRVSQQKQPETPWFLYLIECQNGRLYAGITTNLKARFATHCRGKGAMFTRLNKPKRMLAAKRFSNRSLASKAEWKIKQLRPLQKRELAASWPRVEHLPCINDKLTD